MRKNKSKEETLSKLFITDHALQDSKNDEFGHNDYAILLEKFVKEQPTPFNIGVFGKWGVGKSTIVNLLKEKFKIDIKKGEIKFLEIKVWKYDENSLRRKFIVKIAEGLGLPIDNIYHDIYYDKEYENALLNFRDIFSVILNRKSIALWALIVSFILWIIFRIINIIEIGNPIVNQISNKIEEFLIVPLFLSIIGWVVKIIREAKLKLKISKYDSEEQFENKFIELVKKDKSKKIIFIDDLDRCSKEKVVKTIETIKTFLDVESCIFIIACDDEIIKKAINKSHELYNDDGRNEGAEYLEKFFQYTLRVPPFMVTDMRKFIFNLLKKNKSDLLKLNETLEDIIFITINRNVISPRNAITAINEFSSSYILAQTRELDKSSKLHNKIITNNLPILALITSLKLHFGEFYNDMQKNVELIYWIKEILEGNQNDLNEKQLGICKKYFSIVENRNHTEPDEVEDNIGEAGTNLETENVIWKEPRNEEYRRLFHFIESTKDYLTIPDISPFLFLGIDTTSYLIGDEYLQEFNDALKNGIETKIAEIINEADEPKKAHLFDHISYWIEEKLEAVEQRKALQMLSKQLINCPNSGLHRAARVFYNKFYKININYLDYKKYEPQGIFLCARTLGGIFQKRLINQTINFLNNEDISHDKLLLKEIFKNEDLLVDNKLIKKVISFIDARSQSSTDEGKETELQYLELEYIFEKIQLYKENSNVIRKFFSGGLVEEIVDYLKEVESTDELDEDKYNETVHIFEILKKKIIDSDLKRLVYCYIELITTNNYYTKILDDIENRKDEIPLEEINDLSIALTNELEIIEDLPGINKILNICKAWFEKYNQLKEEPITDEILTQLINLLNNDDIEVFNSVIEFIQFFIQFFKDEEIKKLKSQIILLIKPQEDYTKALKLKKIIVKDKDSITTENRSQILTKLVTDLNTASGIQNSECYSYWIGFYNKLLDLFSESELAVLIKPNNNQFILHINFPEVNNELRSKYCEIIRKCFDRLSTPKQHEYFDLFIPFLTTNTKVNSEYSINELFKVRSFLKGSPFLPSSIQHLINQFTVDIEPNIKFRNIQILFSNKQLLNQQQIALVLDNFVNIVSSDPQNTLNYLFSIWGEITDSIKYSSIKNLLPTDIFANRANTNNILGKIFSDFEQLEEEQIITYLSQRETNLKNNVVERDFYALIINKLSYLINSSTKSQLRTKTIAEIRTETDIELCRNKMSTLIAIKEQDCEKDIETNDMFFALLNDSLEKKKLAIDVFEYYYEDIHPHKRKGALEERFNNLMDEMDNEHKKVLKHLAKKYSLNVKKSFWESLFG